MNDDFMGMILKKQIPFIVPHIAFLGIKHSRLKPFTDH